MATASDRSAEEARVRGIEKDSQKGARGLKWIKRGPAYGGGLKDNAKGASSIAGSRRR